MKCVRKSVCVRGEMYQVEFCGCRDSYVSLFGGGKKNSLYFKFQFILVAYPYDAQDNWGINK